MVDFSPLDALLGTLIDPASTGTALHKEAMPGGASTRKYYRVALGDGRSAVAMFVPEGAKAEEIDKGHGGARWPFLEVRDLLESRGVGVPRVLAEDTARGWLLLEDLGDDTLANYLLDHPEEKSAVYTQAVEDLARAQQSLESLPADSVVAARAFDEDLLRWEIEHFREWALDARGLPLSAADAEEFAALAGRLAQRIAGFAQGFVHRDYQSRNIMVRRDDGVRTLVWIDFQDALLGPRAYDLVALLGDSYQEFDRAFIDDKLACFARARGLDAAELTRLHFEFDWVTVQRKLKDAGRFVFIDRVKDNPSFLKFVTPTVHKVKAALERLESDADARALLALLKRATPDEMA